MNVTPFKRPENRPPQQPQYPPLFNVPPLTLYTLAGIFLIHLCLTFAPGHSANIWGYRLAFVPARYTHDGFFDVWAIVSPFTHLFIHGGWFHVLMNGVMFLAFGAAAERMLGKQKSAMLFVLCGFAGALTQFAIDPFTDTPMIGASGALSGLFAAVLIRLQKTGMMPAGRFGIWGIAALWIGLSLVGALMAGMAGLGDVAWAAHIGGFMAGIGLSRLRYFS